jgi:ribonuclease-3
VLQLITAEYLYKYRPAANEGEMTQIRSAMVNTNTLAALAEELYLGKGIAKGGGRGLKSLLANAFEAVLGAVFLDAGYDAAYHYYLDRFRQLPEPVKDENHKGRLQQVVQERFNQTPFYDSAGARVGTQRREYTAVVFAGEQDAARDALSKLLGTSAPLDTPRPPREPRPRRRRTSRALSAEPGEDRTGDEPTSVEPLAAAEVGGEAPAPKPRRRRAPRRKPAAAPAASDGAAPEPAPEPAPAPPPEPVRSRQFGAPLDD